MKLKTIEELAFRHLSRHPNDKSGHTLATMYHRFGKKASEQAIENVKEILRMVDPEHPVVKTKQTKIDWFSPPNDLVLLQATRKLNEELMEKLISTPFKFAPAKPFRRIGDV